MSVYVTVTVDDPAALLNTSLFGAGAVGRWEYSSDNGVLVPFQEGGTFALVSTTTLYTFYDLAGTPTTWYRLRYSTATPTLTKHYSGYGAAFQPGSQGSYTSADRIRLRLGGRATDADTDDLVRAANAANAEINDYVGFYIGPSNDTTRTFDGQDAVRAGTRLWIRGGIRRLTAISLGWASNDTSIAGLVTDVNLMPRAYDMAPGMPAQWLDVVRYPAGTFYVFPPFTGNILLTGDFGMAVTPAHVLDIADQLGMWKWMSKQSGTVITTGDYEGTVYPFLTRPQMYILDDYRMPVAA